MKKLLSLGLAIVMMLSCVLCQAVLVSAADAVDSTNAPYAGVYQVTSDKAVTLTNETGHVVTLAAGATDYFYLIKGANDITTTDDSANVTFTALADNGMAFINEVNEGNVPHLITDTDYTIDVGSGVYLVAGASQTFEVSGVKAGLYYMATVTSSNMTNVKVSSGTGFYDSYDAIAAYSTAYYKNGTDMVLLYLREGTNTITYTNEGSVSGTITGIRVSNTTPTQTVYADQHFIKGLYVTPYVAPVEPTQSPAPTEEPVVTPAPADGITYTAPYAGVYEVTSDKAVTLTNETGHVVTLEADVTDYFYLIQGVNKIATTDDSANVIFTALADNGMAYINEVDEGSVPHLITDTSYLIYQDTGFILAAGASVTLEVNDVKAGLYYMATATQSSINNLKVESDTGFYDVYDVTNPGNASYYKNGVDMVLLYLRDGTNYITYTNQDSVAAVITLIQVSDTTTPSTVDNHAVQLFISGLHVTPYVAAEESFVNNQTANFAEGALTFAGKVGADYLDLAYGVEIGGKKFYGAKDGDTVSDGAEGTKVFSFDAWDGTFEIILTNITEKGTAGEKTYKFFVGEDYTEEATVTVE